MNTFIKNNYAVIPNVIGKELTSFLFEYLKNKREAYEYLNNIQFISPFNTIFGFKNDEQIPNTYAQYGDIALDMLLPFIKEKVEKEVRSELVENYTYARLYKRYDTLVKHKDRISCEISGTMMLGGDQWPIFLKNKKTIKVDLNPGDLLLYKGCKLEHWRDPFEGMLCAQVFLHYNVKTDETAKTKFDGRAMLGIPHETKNI
jgi:hypothetical protein